MLNTSKTPLSDHGNQLESFIMIHILRSFTMANISKGSDQTGGLREGVLIPIIRVKESSRFSLQHYPNTLHQVHK